MEDEELTPDQVSINAAGAESFTTDGNSAKQVPISDQIKAAQFAAANKPAVRRSKLLGARFVPIYMGEN